MEINASIAPAATRTIQVVLREHPTNRTPRFRDVTDAVVVEGVLKIIQADGNTLYPLHNILQITEGA